MSQRQPAQEDANIQATVPVEGEAVPTSQRRRRASTGGFRQKLDAPQRPGYVRRWVDGTPSRLLEMEEMGYTPVTEKAGEDETRTDGLGTRITRHAGSNKDGSAQRMVLMETPASEYALGVQDKEAALKPFEDALRKGRPAPGGEDEHLTVEPRSISRQTG